MQVPGNHLQPNVLATAHLSPSKPVSSRRNGGRVLDQGRPHWQKPPAPVSAPRAPALHPLVYAQQLGWSGLANSGNNARLQAQNHGAYGQVHAAAAASPPSLPPIPPLAATVQTYPLGNFPYYSGNFLGSQAHQLPQQATNSVMRQQDLAAYPTQFFHPQAAFQHQLQLVPVFVQNQNPTETAAGQPTTGATEYKDPFVYVQPPPDAFKTEQGRELYRRPPKTRIRVAQACEPCRKRKSKCTGARPKCKRCDKKNLDCVYAEDHRANKLRGTRNRMLTSVPVAELDEDYDGDVNLPPCPPAAASCSSSSTYSCSSGYSTGSVLDSTAPPPSSSNAASEAPCLPFPIYVPPRIPPLVGPSMPRSGSGINASAQGSSGPGPPAVTRAPGGLTDAQTAVRAQPTATGSGSASYQYNVVHPQQAPSCVPAVSTLGSQQIQHMLRPQSCLPAQECIAGMSWPRSTPLTTDTYHASMCTSRGLGQCLAAVAKEMEVPFLYAPPPLGRDRSSGSSSSSRPHGARSGAQTPTDYFSIPLPAGTQWSSGNDCSQRAAQTALNVPPPMQAAKADSVASGFAQMNLDSMSSGGVPLPGSLVSAMSGQDWEGGYALEYEDWFHSFPESLPDFLPSESGDLPFYR